MEEIRGKARKRPYSQAAQHAREEAHTACTTAERTDGGQAAGEQTPAPRLVPPAQSGQGLLGDRQLPKPVLGFPFYSPPVACVSVAML